MAALSDGALHPFLSKLCNPYADPDRFDELSRQAQEHWLAGGTMTEFVAAVQAETDLGRREEVMDRERQLAAMPAPRPPRLALIWSS